MKVIDWLLGVAAFLGIIVWCSLWIGAFVGAAAYLVTDGELDRAFVVGAALAGLWFALWIIAKVFRYKRI